jgi:hypothetical protein
LSRRKAADPLDRRRIDAKPCRDLASALVSSRLVQRRPDLFFEIGQYRRTPKPFSFASGRASPARTRSGMMLRSNSANTPGLWNIVLPAGVGVTGREINLWNQEIFRLFKYGNGPKYQGELEHLRNWSPPGGHAGGQPITARAPRRAFEAASQKMLTR